MRICVQLKKWILLLLLIPLCSCSEDEFSGTTVQFETIADIYDSQYIGSHRGLFGFPENSFLGISAAFSIGYKMVEIDPAMTKDSVLVVHHDRTIDRISNGSGKISSFTYDELLAFDFGVKCDSSFMNTKITLMEDVCRFVDYFPGGGCLEIDFSTYIGQQIDVIDATVNLVKKYHLLPRVLFCCYVDKCEHILSLCEGKANLDVILSKDDFASAVGRIKQYVGPSHFTYVSINKDNLTEEMIDYCHNQGLKVEVWTVNCEVECKNLKEIGCDYILSDTITPLLFEWL